MQFRKPNNDANYFLTDDCLLLTGGRTERYAHFAYLLQLGRLRLLHTSRACNNGYMAPFEGDPAIREGGK